MKKKVLSTIGGLLFALMILFNAINPNLGDENLNNISFEDIGKVALAGGEEGSGQYYYMVWTGHCFVCVWSMFDSYCNVSDQCCMDQDPYC